MKKFLRLYSWFFGIPLIELIFLLFISRTANFSFLQSFGTVLGLISYIWFTFIFILTARPINVEKGVGQDNLIKFHITLSSIALALAVVHARFLMSSGEFNSVYLRISASILGGYLIIMILAWLFLSRKPKPGRKLRLRYNITLVIHNFSLFLTGLLWIHVMKAQALQEFIFLKILYSIHFLVAFLFWVYHKIIRVHILKKSPYVLTAIQKETHDIWALTLSSSKGKSMNFEAGQFGYLAIEQKGFSKEFHPFTIASSPNVSNISILIKELGDYTSNLNQVQVGSRVLLDGPYGTFKPLRTTVEELVFIAGGVGITPFLASLDVLKESTPDQKVTLIYGVRTQADLIKSSYFEELEQLMPNFRYIPVLSDDDAWAGDQGFIDQPCLENYAACEDSEPSHQTKAYFICGPPLMIKLVTRSLKRMHVPPKYIHVEQF